MKRTLLTSTLLIGLAAPALADKAAVLTTYSDIAEATFGDSLIKAKELQAAIETLISDPTDASLAAARAAWKAARVPYLQSEVFRFGNPAVDDWEGKVNAWPLDEGLIDYVDTSYGGPSDENEYAALNVIANPTFTLSGTEIDASAITPDLIANTLHEADEVEANVASGYHAIEFLLWGQDLNGTAHGAGNRPYTDYVQGDGCTNGNCDRRSSYLSAATELLISDLEHITEQWSDTGASRAALLSDTDAGIVAILTGMGSLSYGELAGERMKLGVLLNDPEEEQDCFSDNTHNSHYYDGLGIRNVYFGDYVRADGTTVSGESLSSLVAEVAPEVDTELRANLNQTMIELAQIKTAAEAGFSYDQMLEQGNDAGEELILSAVDSLLTQTRSIERAVTALGLDQIGFEGSDSLDNPNAVFQ
ncbi:imelysin family protein [Primorskyibacter sp. 2E107]|uniref:imelysin family protein n=1 Tax=Primorskyibacter sp. 2E107 TaxID=3403458 RepID=UPI003AF6CED0